MSQPTDVLAGNQTIERQIANFVAVQVLRWMDTAGIVDTMDAGKETVLWAIPHPDRIIIAVNPIAVRAPTAFLRHSSRTEQVLSSVLQGRRVSISAGKGFFIQIAYFTEDTVDLESKPLDLAAQKTPLHVPIGVMPRGALWRALPKMQHVLIGGAPGTGKTNFTHTWIQALLRGESARLVLFDGKDGLEYGMYAGAPRTQVVEGNDLTQTLELLAIEMTTRFEDLKRAGVRNVDQYNAGRGGAAQMERVILFVDELSDALASDEVLQRLLPILRKGRAVGIHCVLATQRPSADVVPGEIKGLCPTRIAFAVPDAASSRVILDRSGAERLPANAPGRLIFLAGAAAVIAHAYAAPEFTRDPEWKDAVLPDDSLSAEESEYLSIAVWRLAGQWRAEEIAEILRAEDTRTSGAAGSGRAYAVNKNRVALAAQRLERVGYLTPILTESGTGRRLGRKLTDKATARLGVGAGMGVAAE